MILPERLQLTMKLKANLVLLWYSRSAAACLLGRQLPLIDQSEFHSFSLYTYRWIVKLDSLYVG